MDRQTVRHMASDQKVQNSQICTIIRSICEYFPIFFPFFIFILVVVKLVRALGRLVAGGCIMYSVVDFGNKPSTFSLLFRSASDVSFPSEFLCFFFLFFSNEQKPDKIVLFVKFP